MEGSKIVALVNLGLASARWREHQHGRIPTASRKRELTDCPIPVRLRSLVVALGLQSKLEVGDVGTMPRQEKTGEMDLSGENARVSQLIDLALAGFADFIGDTYHWVQIHVGVNEV